MIRKFLDLSTAHLTPETRDRLVATKSIAELPFAGGMTGYGWFAYCHDENCGDGNDAIPAEMFAVMQHARSLGCDYVLFDSDAEIIPGLPTFEEA